MKRLFALPLALLLSLPLLASKPAILDSVEPLQWVDNTAAGLVVNTHCTAGQVGAHYHLTAFHCVRDDEQPDVVADRAYFAGTKQVKVFDTDPANDLALLVSKDYNDAPLTLADSVEFGQHIEMAGYAYGWNAPTFVQGVLGSPFVNVEWRNEQVAIYVLTCAPGHSGSPIVDIHGQVVGVLQAGPSAGADPICIGPTLDVLRGFAGWAFDE